GEGACGVGEEGSRADVDVDHRKIAVELQACRGERAAVPRQHLGLIDSVLWPSLLDRPLAVVEQRLEAVPQHSQAIGGARLHQILPLRLRYSTRRPAPFAASIPILIPALMPRSR